MGREVGRAEGRAGGGQRLPHPMLVPGVEWGPGCFLLWTLPRYPQEHTGAQRSTAGEQGVKASLGLQSWGSQMPGGPEGAWHPQPYPLPDITPAPSSSLLQLRATGLSWQLSQEASQRGHPRPSLVLALAMPQVSAPRPGSICLSLSDSQSWGQGRGASA